MKFSIIGLALLLTACSNSDYGGVEDDNLAVTPEQKDIRYHSEHIPNLSWGDNKEVKSYQHYFISGLPSEKSLLYARALGITAIIDLRPTSQTSNSEKERANQLEMDYISIPTPANANFGWSVYEKLAAALEKDSEKLYLIHHVGIDVAAAWFAAYIGIKGSLNTETALSIADSVGLQDATLRDHLAKFLDDPQELPVDEKNTIDNTSLDFKEPPSRNGPTQ